MSTEKSALQSRTSASPLPRQVDSKSLLGPDGLVVIVHDGQHYILRQTQAGKLILTK